MPAPPRPNPSFYVLEISSSAKAKKAGKILAAAVSGEDGNPLAWIGGDSYVLSRAAAKQINIGRDRDGVLRFLGGVTGVDKAEWRTASEIRAQYEARPAGRKPRDGTPRLANPWNIAMVRAPQAWGMFDGGLGGAKWKGVRVGHIDTGYTEHPAFGPWQQGRSPSQQPHEGINYVNKGVGALPLDPLNYNGNRGHGTRTSSLIAGYDMRGQGFKGIAPQATVIPYRLTNSVVIDSLGNDVELGAALKHAAFDSSCRVISISLGDPCFPPRSAGRMVDELYENGVIIVAAAGNVTSEVTYPGRYSRTIAAGGMTKRRQPWNGSSRGRMVDISAPAHDIYRADSHWDWQTGKITCGYEDGGDGTSYATAHVAGAAVLWLAFHGAALDGYGNDWRVVEAFRTALKGSATVPSDWNSALFGAGILNVESLLSHPLPAPGSLDKNRNLAEKQRH